MALMSENLVTQLYTLSTKIEEYAVLKTEQSRLDSLPIPLVQAEASALAASKAANLQSLTLVDTQLRSLIGTTNSLYEAEPKTQAEKPAPIVGNLADPAKLADYLKVIDTSADIASKILPNLNDPAKLLDESLNLFQKTGWELNIKIPSGSTEKQITLINAGDVIKLTRSIAGLDSDKTLKPEDILSGLVIRAEKNVLGFSLVETAQELQELDKQFKSGLLDSKKVTGAVISKVGNILGAIPMPNETRAQLNSMLALGQGIMNAITDIEKAYEQKTKSLADKIKAEQDAASGTTTTTTSTSSTTDVESSTSTTTNPDVPVNEGVETPSPVDEGANTESPVMDDTNNQEQAPDPELIEVEYDAYDEGEVEGY